ncbi:hypothetical protein E8E11_001761 [Didymella keratinophila]|nr:hypothetical protein E8E11_001761 [Didymella keratinophila]
MRPAESYRSLLQAQSLYGKRIGVRKMYIGKNDPAAQPIWISPAVRKLWVTKRITLEALGAAVEEVDFPFVTNYETAGVLAGNTSFPLPAPGNDTSLDSPPELWAYGWDDFLSMFPNTIQDRYGNRLLKRTEGNVGIVSLITGRNASIYSVPGVGTHLKALEARRRRDLEDWMDSANLDLLVWPSVDDVGPQDAETNETAAELAWRNGVYFSNGNYAIRQLVPTVSVFMVSGTFGTAQSGALDNIEVYLDGILTMPTFSKDGSWTVLVRKAQYDDPIGDVRVRFLNVPDQSLPMVIVLATASDGRSDAFMLWV